MSKKISLGIDRPIPLYWANYALELFMTNPDMTENYSRLRKQLDQSSDSKETPRKIANHLKRLWLSQTDEFGSLREQAASIIRQNSNSDLAIIQLGMACNTFPLFHQVCQKIGEIARVSESINTTLVTERILQVFATPTTIPPAVSRVIKTLEDWKFINQNRSEISIIRYNLADPEIGTWLIRALFMANNRIEIPIYDIEVLPELLGLHYSNIRECVKQSDNLVVRRGLGGEENVCLQE